MGYNPRYIQSLERPPHQKSQIVFKEGIWYYHAILSFWSLTRDERRALEWAESCHTPRVTHVEEGASSVRLICNGEPRPFAFELEFEPEEGSNQPVKVLPGHFYNDELIPWARTIRLKGTYTVALLEA